LIPTDNKVIIKRLTKIMIALYMIILKGHCIDDNYMRVKIGYLIKEYSKSTWTPFGWKYLKYLINNFKEDKEFIAKEILINNSCSWFINEKYFSKKIREMKP
jgi:phosphatidylinositol 4-kinase